MSDFIDESLLKDYFDEAYNQIDIIESNLLILEKNSNDKDAIDAIFRAAHTLKGGSATVHMDELTNFTHLLEDAMDEIRSGKVKITSNIIDTLLSALDIIKNMVKERSNSNIYSANISKTVNELKNIVKGGESQNIEKEQEEKEDLSKHNSVTISEYDLLEINESNPDNLPLYKMVITFNESNPMRTVGGIQVFTSLREIALVIKTIPDFDEIYSEVFHREVVYIVASNSPKEKLIQYATIPDTTVDIKIYEISKDGVTEDIKKRDSKKEDKKDKKEEEKKIKETIKEIKETKEDIKKERKEDILKKEPEIKDIEKEENIIIDHKEIDLLKNREKKDTLQNQKVASSSILRVESSRIDDLLNLVSEIVINKATFNQLNLQFVENLENLSFNINEYKDKLKLFIDKIPELIDKLKEGNTYLQIKKEIQDDFVSLTNQFDSFFSKYKAIIDRFRATSQSLDRISSSLQEGVMRVRMVPIKQIFTRFPRLVRDLSRDLKKEVELVLEGEETEIDKAMIDDLIDPLIHIVRNAIDHGFESPEEREKLGKRNPGILRLSAQNEGNLITISITDDGKGIDTEKIRKKAIEKGLLSSDKILRDSEIYNFIFEPGFSTAEKVTSVSGRGVGLDVVKRNIEKLSGTIRVTSEPGKGTTLLIKLPLTLAIIQGLMVNVQDQIYAIPISSVLESIRITHEEIKSIDNYEVINVRDDVLSLLRLNRLFKLKEESGKVDYYFVVIVGSGDKKIGLLVDSLIGEEDIVIKPLKDKYTSTPGIAGATILGDGTVSLILDVSQLIDLGLKDGIELNKKRKT